MRILCGSNKISSPCSQGPICGKKLVRCTDTPPSPFFSFFRSRRSCTRNCFLRALCLSPESSPSNFFHKQCEEGPLSAFSKINWVMADELSGEWEG
jgi:hypothetical protein